MTQLSPRRPFLQCIKSLINNHILLQSHSTGPTGQQKYIPGERRLLVKVVKASDLGGQQGCFEPYCVVEVDDPPQKHQTSVKKNTVSPIWDEAFLL